MANRRKIFVCSAGFGEGHNTAARNLVAALGEVGGDHLDAEFLDVFGLCRPRVYEAMRKGYIGLMNHAPSLWSLAYRLFDARGSGASAMPFLGPERRVFAKRLADDRPAVVVSTYPAYGYLLNDIARRGGPTGFRRVTVVTDSISVNSVWHRCGSDFFSVPNEQTAEVMRQAGVPAEKLRVLGFPVEGRFGDADSLPARPDVNGPDGRRVLYMINAGRRAAPEIVRRLLALDVALTITTGRDEQSRLAVEHAIAAHGSRSRPVRVIGWTREVPELLCSHHLVISKAGGATTQEAIAAGCPMVVSQIAPGQEEGNAALLTSNNVGRLSLEPAGIADAVVQAFAEGGRVYHEWSANLAKLSRPNAARDNACFILQQVLEHVP